MTLQEAEAKLSELNAEIDRLLKEREAVLKQWNTAFSAENPEGITCVDESIGDCYNLYLVNGAFRMHVCILSSYDMKDSIETFYKRIDTSMYMLHAANGGGFDIPEYQKNLIYAKAMEIRERTQTEKALP